MICIYHSRDLDGYSSAAIVKLKYPDAILIGFDYGQPIPWDKIPENEPIIMVDVSVPITDMEKLVVHSGFQFTLIDHHKSAIEEIVNYAIKTRPEFNENDTYDYTTRVWNPIINGINCVLQNGIAACEITWNYLFPGTRIPDAIKFLGQYDTWRKDEVGVRWESEILPFQFGMRLICNSPETFPMGLLSQDPDDDDRIEQKITEILNNGITILEYQRMQNEITCKAAFETTFEGLRAICVNTSLFNSDVFKSVYDPAKHSIMMPFKYDGKSKQWIVSIYSTKKEIDCSVLAKIYGGGGHKGAAGFQCSTIGLIDIFKKEM